MILEKKNGKTYYPLVDITKFIFAIMIVLMHADFLDNTIEIDYRIQITIFALIVPFFFVSSGFFVGRKSIECHNSDEKSDGILMQQKRFIKLYLVFGGWYYFVGIIKAIIIDHNFVDEFPHMIHQLLVETPGGGIWFVYTLIWCFFILYIIIKRDKEKYLYLLMIILSFLYIAGAVFFAKVFSQSQVRLMYDRVLLTDHNLFFYGVFFFGGYYFGIYYNRIELCKRIILPVSVCSSVIYVLFGLVLYDWNVILEVIVFATLKMIAVFSIFYIGLIFATDKPKTRFIRKISTVIYFTHWNFIYFIILLERTLTINKRILALLCATMSFCFSLFIIMFNHGRIYKILFE